MMPGSNPARTMLPGAKWCWRICLEVTLAGRPNLTREQLLKAL